MAGSNLSQTLRSESGLISAGAVIALAIAGLFVYLLLGALQGDSAHYGSVPIPSNGAAVELPGRETDVFYAEGTKQSAGAPLIPPSDLSFSITDENGQGIRTDSRGGEPKDTDTGSARVIGAAFPPEEGTYLVSATSDELSGRTTPMLTFGQGPVGAVQDRFEGVVDELKGPTGVIVLVVLGFLFLLPRFQRALARRDG